MNKIAVTQSTTEIESLRERYPNSFTCLYLAYKSPEDWEKSTSRVYMNQISPDFVYIPVNIAKDDHQSLKSIYRLTRGDKRIIAINQTQPHKSNPILMELFHDRSNLPTNIDAIIKNESGELEPYDLNGPSFTNWFHDEVGNFKDKQVVLIGVGGVGEPIARKIVLDSPRELILVDPQNKQALADELSMTTYTSYRQPDDLSLSSLGNLVIINAAGKEGLGIDSATSRIIETCTNKENIFIDLRPQLDIDVVNQARAIGWQAFTGYGMNARNDYTLLEKIAELTHIHIPDFTVFKELVRNAS